MVTERIEEYLIAVKVVARSVSQNNVSQLTDYCTRIVLKTVSMDTELGDGRCPGRI
jgi:hypothetical protein